jgi:hypothetical protein
MFSLQIMPNLKYDCRPLVITVVSQNDSNTENRKFNFTESEGEHVDDSGNRMPDLYNPVSFLK